MSPLFKLANRDFLEGAVVAVLGTVFVYGASIFNAPGFELSQLDWNQVIKVALGAFMGFVATKFGTASNGKIGGVL